MFIQSFIPSQNYQGQNQLIQQSQPSYFYTYNQVINNLPPQINRIAIKQHQNGVLSSNNLNIYNQNQVIQNYQAQVFLNGYSYDQIFSQDKLQLSYVQDFHLEKNDENVINNHNFYESNIIKSIHENEEQIDFLQVKMKRQDDLDAHASNKLRCSFSTNLTNVDRSYFEIVCSIGNQPFQINETQIEDEQSSNDQEQIMIQSLYSSQFISQIPPYQYKNSHNQPQVKQSFNASPQQTNEQNQIKRNQKQEFLNHNFLIDNLKQEFLKFYGLKDEKKLAHQIHDDLSSKVKERRNGEFTKMSTLKLKQQLDCQYFTFKQCVYANLNSGMSKQFVNYCGEINLNDNKERVINNQFYHNFLNIDDSKNKVNISINDNNNNFKNYNQFIDLNKKQSHSNLFKNFFCLKPNSASFLKNFDFSEIRLNQPKQALKIRNKKENSSYIKNSQFHNLNKLFMYNILSMFRTDSLKNFNLPEIISQELSKIIQRFKISSQRKHKKQNKGFYSYFTHSHYNILFLKLNDMNFHQIKNSPLDLDLHQQCFNIDLSKDVSEIEIAYMNLIKEINYQIFVVNIREQELIDDGTQSKQNIRIKYALKAIIGIKKISKGNLIKKF
ncbi:hypothetical protein TTHERM_00003770 (macronuclear) [Tetrahymena thermophila SB210]|uniref:Uncharacterized protein n=1 Tax=Tetrahymena thermophila (strain SB210) TaxID=312017 RepID=Q22SF8_TETTS|nr:hypothetical protein TTHERM_00003770 [Tetrahymena thermophila SB210]EAR87814.2 hypothetical protein TTHERM_00003770 [Tetrahymena thermophila SB210]|eukprot:XP_001008059.2 hypothetical protein TTHERM_00003770 [Tetrahymena thermophila SB210]